MAQSPSIAVIDELLQQGEQYCLKHLETNPEDENILGQLGKIYRKTGKLIQSAEIYSSLSINSPENKYYRDMSDLLKGFSTDLSEYNISPCPFRFYEDVLSEELHNAVLADIVSREQDFKPAKVGGDQYDHSYKDSVRQALSVTADYSAGYAVWEAILPFVSDYCAQYGYEPNSPNTTAVQYFSYTDGFYKKHRDRTRKNYRNRDITVLYYLNQKPRRYSGGDVFLYDTDISNNINGEDYTRISPVDNSLLLFSSDYYHEVLEVNAQNCSFQNARYVVAVWVTLDTESFDLNFIF